MEVKNKIILIKPLKLSIDIKYLPNFIKLNQVELSNNYAFISVEVSESEPYTPKTVIGLDRNATGHIAVLADLSSGKVLKLGKKCPHIRNKYRNIKDNAKSKKKFKFLKKISRKEANVMKDLNHKIAKDIIQHCVKNQAILVIENLSGISKNRKGKKLNKILSGWSFYQLEQFLVYKAKIYGVPIAKINPEYTSQNCSICKRKGLRDGKNFKCEFCGHIDHSDVNAAFNIADRYFEDLFIIYSIIMKSILLEFNLIKPGYAQVSSV